MQMTQIGATAEDLSEMHHQAEDAIKQFYHRISMQLHDDSLLRSKTWKVDLESACALLAKLGTITHVKCYIQKHSSKKALSEI